MPIIRAMAIHQGASGLPKDRYINNWHFVSDIGVNVEEIGETIGGLLDGFYATVDAYIPTSITREPYRLYDLADEEPRPVTFVDATAQPASAADRLPYEVAACLSFYGTRNLPSRRGRVFLGPLTVNALSGFSESDDPQISPGFRTAVVAAAVAMGGSAVGGIGDEQLAHAVWSPTTNLAIPVLNYWMDNAFDTIRSRGSDATARTTGTIVP